MHELGYLHYACDSMNRGIAIMHVMYTTRVHPNFAIHFAPGFDCDLITRLTIFASSTKNARRMLHGVV